MQTRGIPGTEKAEGKGWNTGYHNKAYKGTFSAYTHNPSSNNSQLSSSKSQDELRQGKRKALDKENKRPVFRVSEERMGDRMSLAGSGSPDT